MPWWEKNLECLQRVWAVRLVPISGVVLILVFQWAFLSADRGLTRRFDLLILAEEVQRDLAQAHLWLEEYLAHDTSVDLEDHVMSPLRLLLARTDRIRDKYRLRVLDGLREDLVQIQTEVEERLDDVVEGRAGGELDQRFDRRFRKILESCSTLARQTQEDIASSRQTFFRLNALAVVGLGVLFGILTFLVYRNRGGLIRRQAELEESVADRTRELSRLNDELISARDSAEEASRAKSVFLANMSHEIRTPLHAVIGTASLLEARSRSAEERSALRSIVSSGRALLSLLDEILDFSSAEAGRLRIQEGPFRLAEVVDSVIELFRPAAAAGGVELRGEISPPVPRCLVGAGGRLRQILTNLVSNAVKFTESGGTVQLRVRPANTEEPDTLRLCFEVEDSGAGFEASELPRLFEPFTQSDESLTREQEGSGLGLAISQELVDRLGGHLEAESTVGQGTVFRFCLTFREAPDLPDEEDPELHPPGSAEPDSRGARVLVVDDNAINQKLTARMLEQLGYTAQVAESGERALALVRDQDFAAVLMDCQMPELDGYEATRKLRALPGRERLPVLALTAHARPEDREKSRRAGMNDHLAKPVELGTLASALARWVSAPTEDQDSPETQGVLETLRRLESEENPGFTREVVTLFLEELPHHVGGLERAWADADGDELGRQAHRLRSGALHLGASAVAETCRRLESESGRKAQRTLLDELGRAVKELRRSLEGWIVRLNEEEPS